MFPGALLTWLLLLQFQSTLSQGTGEIRFANPVYNVSIPENSVGKTYARQPPGEDTLGLLIPHNINIDLKYKIINGDENKFFKAEEKIVGDYCFLLIRIRTGNTNVLNRERKEKYNLEVRASVTRKDGKNKILLETDTTVIVKVLDKNDLSPLFLPTEYSVVVQEDVPLHKSITKVTAEDADIGLNGEIYYSFLEDTNQFAVHPSSGVITVTRSLTKTERIYHELTVQGKDRGAFTQSVGSSHAARAKLTIKIQRVNLHGPEIYIKHLADIVENNEEEIYAIVRVIDKDEGIHGEIKSLEIVDGDPDGHFRIKKSSGHSGEYNIIVHSLLDREKAPLGYNLTLKAIDRGIPPKQSFKSITVRLVDTNDNAPIFHKEIYEVNVPETAPINTPVIRLKVTDVDLGKNARVLLEIVGGNEGGEFYVNPETGMLYTAIMLDAEYKSFHTLTVSAIDQGSIGTRKQSSAKVKINIIDTNDNDPLFEKTEVKVWMNENEPPGTYVTKVTAKDKDSGENAYISYSIANLNPVPFEIDHFSGVIKTTQVLDYESMKRQFVLKLRASDWGLPYRRQTEMQLTINVNDINDNRPQFEQVECHAEISRFMTIGTELFTVTAIDLDVDSVVTYQIVAGNDDSCFGLDSTSGVLIVTCDLKNIIQDEREINITASDGSHVSETMRIRLNLVSGRKSSGRFTVDGIGKFNCKDTGASRRLSEVLLSAEKNNMQTHDSNQDEFAMMPSRYGENIHSPEFIDFPLEIKVNESVILGTTLTRVKARDRDLGYNGKLIFGISGGDKDSVFRIDPETGDLKVIGYLDRERENQYFLNITVYDLGKPQKSLSRVLPITVMDINDNPPKFIKVLSSYKVLENVINGTIVCTLKATDADSGEFAKIKYFLITDTHDFSIHPFTGVLAVNNLLDRERQNEYELKIRAKDNGGLYSEAIVRVIIEDVNDNTPKFSGPTLFVKIREDIPKGAVVIMADAIDADTGFGGEIVYSIAKKGESDSLFKIDSTTGIVRTAGSLDFEEKQVHNIIVVANDRGKPSLSSEVSVVIDVIDVNENLFAPVFEDVVVESSVRENKPIGTRVITVSASDSDPPGLDSRIVYSIKGGDGMGYFSIDNEGVIRTMAVLDAETKDYYWLTVCAQDQGVVPLHSCVKVYIVVENENDCVPLTVESVYKGKVQENSPGGKVVLQLQAVDGDIRTTNSPPTLSYKILSGDPGGHFQLNSTTGIISTTSRRLDRETQAQFSLEIQVLDNDDPSLASTTRVLIDVTDINDHAPVFLEQYHNIKVPAGKKNNMIDSKEPELAMRKTFNKEMDLGTDEEGLWDIYNGDLSGYPIFRVLAFDEDEGENCRVLYSIKPTKGKNIFHINPTTGVVYSTDDLEPGTQHEINIRASDTGIPPKVTTSRVFVEVVPVQQSSPNPPEIVPITHTVKVMESDKIGFLVASIQGSDPDNETLWFHIVDGDVNDDFYIDQESGNVLLAKKLLWERKNGYSLNISVTDGVHTVYTKLNIAVINDINEEGPSFGQSYYVVNVSENFAGGNPIISLRASGGDNLLYSIHNSKSLASLNIFRIDTLTGDVTIKEPLDRETIDEHILTIMVRDQGIIPKRSYTRVLVRIYDHNDHSPEFNSKIIQAKVFETSSIGTAIVRILASDKDKGENAIIKYSISSGNIGNMFSIDPDMGDIILVNELDLNTAFEYTLQVKATNPGPNSLSSTIPVHIMVIMADDANPKFLKQSYSADIYENEPRGTFVFQVEARSTSTLLFDIVEGNTNNNFEINPSTGIITTTNFLDYEEFHVFNLTVLATNMGGASTECSVIIHILDRNDNPPIFLNNTFFGNVLESAPISSLVFSNTSNRLVLTSEDVDSGTNGIVTFEIIEPLANNYFHIDTSTGTIKTLKILDYETTKNYFFHVRAYDLGTPKLYSENLAKVYIEVIDVNDCSPKFSQQDYNITLLLPTYKNVAITTLEATDVDTPKEMLKYDIIDGDKKNIFAINASSGTITILHPEKVKQPHKLHVRVSDGKHSTIAQLYVNIENSESRGLKFQKNSYEGSVTENSTKIMTVTVVNVLGSVLNEHVEFRILNPTDLFNVGLTSGAVQTTGLKFDRENKDNYVLIVEARSFLGVAENKHKTPKVAHVIVNVTVMDVNDNCPMFVNLPYYAIVSVDDEKGHVIAKVHAIDLDTMENGEVRYEMKRGHGELFKVCRKTGEISLKQSLEGHNKEYQLIIGAYDGGVTPCYSETTVSVKVVDKSMPVFEKQFYSFSVKENIEVFSAIGEPLQASSPLVRKLIYSIVKGNENEKFTLDFNSALDSINGPCVLFASEELDYEEQQLHQLVIRATDSVTGIFAEVTVSVVIEDVNDSPPEFAADSYHISVSEAAPFGSFLSKMEAYDNDTGINKEIVYSMSNPGNNASLYFHVDSIDGSIYLKKSLDRETFPTHHFSVVATDKGLPSLSSSVHVWVTVLDMNDNPPHFEQSLYTCILSQHASRGHFVTRVIANDPDVVDQGHLSYSIAGGNDRQAFYINNTNGEVFLSNIEKFGNSPLVILNISVSDGVYTSFCRVKINLHPANKHLPQFIHATQEASVMENKPIGLLVATVKAEDEDFGEYGTISYSIVSNYLKETFAINSDTGVITTLKTLDREIKEEYDIPIMAMDGGGKPAFTSVKIKVEDDNDNAPVFYYKEYKITTYLNQSFNKIILQVKAFDRDVGNNADISYSLYNVENTETALTEIFEVDAVSGAISLIGDTSAWEPQVFQFWIKASDNGVPVREATVPVEIYFVSNENEIPEFDTPHDKYFVVENSPQGTVITQLKLKTTGHVTLRILPSNYDLSLFHINAQQQLVITGSLDREARDLYLIGIVAETDSSPQIIGFTEVTLNVLDENDNAPFFHTSPMYLLLAENVDLGTTITRVQAEDHDFGSNGEVRYALGLDSVVGNTFAIDPFTGWISTLVELDRETQPMYKFQVLAMDNGHQKHITRMTVVIRLKDYNDCPPVFTKQLYQTSVKEDAKPGTIITTLEITDNDLDITPVEFYLISGDPQCQFHVKSTGEVFVTKKLDRESVSHYEVKIIATDGRHTASTTLAINILDVNDNPPYCLRQRYYEMIPENAAIGTNVLIVLASDADEEQNAKLRYFLSGSKSEHFTIEKHSGELKTAVLLDREKIWKYSLIAHVQDREKSNWECSCEINIQLTDVNDNAPQFSINQYSVTVPEDVEVGTLITKVHAVDKDQGVNKIVRYSLLDNLNGQFSITSETGLITVLSPLDRETKSTFHLEVRASDQGHPSLWSQTMLHLTVLDVNDNPPEFGMKNYFASIPEINQIGSEVIRVLATSKDSGVNADIFYSIVNGNEHQKFTIDARTGIISTADVLDYEKTKEYILSVQAMDKGVPPLSNIATVNISITDSNDNAPIFRQKVYAIQVREDVMKGTNIMQVAANDPDSGANGQVLYSIEKGNTQNKFTINTVTGYVSVISPLDRETHAIYVLEVNARDKGVPPLSSTTIINVEITDANDNPPLFSQTNYTAILQEDKPIGFLLLEFVINDKDVYPNAGPYIFDIRSGNEDLAFNLEQDGLLKTAMKFNHRKRSKYVLQIRVFDNGSPPLYSDTWVNVRVIEESQHPPVVAPLEISINSLTDEFGGGEIGKIVAFDQDNYDRLSFNLIITNELGNNTPDFFRLNDNDGRLFALPQIDVGEYFLNVSVSDGKFTTYSNVKIYIELITEDMLRNSIVIRFRDVSPKLFLVNHRNGFVRAIRNAMTCHLKDIVIISIQPSSDDMNIVQHKDKRFISTTFQNTTKLVRINRGISHDLDVLFSVRKNNLQGVVEYYKSEMIRRALNTNLDELEESSKLVVEEMIRVKCKPHFCAYGECLERVVLDRNNIVSIHTNVMSLITPHHEHKTECRCQDGYGGERCETIVNECAKKPCGDNEKCYPDKSIQGYTCQCDDRHEDGRCHVETPKCYNGNCLKPANAVYFGGKSYAQYKIGKELFNGKRFFEDFFTLTLKIKTLNLSGNLIYAVGKIDYSILEIINGVVQYRLELGSGEGIIRVSSVKVSDGRWHEVRLERDGSSAKVTVDGKHVAHGSAPGINGILNLHTDDLFFGAEVKEHPAILGLEDVQRGFVGCLGDIKVSNEIIPLHNGGVGGSLILKRIANVEFSCPTILDLPGPCGALPCLNGGSCTNLQKPLDDENAKYECNCHERFLGPHCEIDVDPCASQPCLYGGVCSALSEGQYECACSRNLFGRRCEVGRWCGGGGACLHGGTCEEGDIGPTCRCHGYYGPLCEFDVDECKGDPCLNGATCINEAGSFRCVCPPDKTGMHCGNPLHSNAITSGVYDLIGRDRILWLLSAIGGTIVLILLCAVIVGCQKRQCRIPSDSKPHVLNSNIKQHEMQILKQHGSKLSNLEVQCSVMGTSVSERPVSYTPVTTVHDPQVILNNMDILRNYGSAGDDLENTPPDYRRNLNKDKSGSMNSSCGNVDSLHKPSWSDQMHIQSFQDHRINNDLTGKSCKEDNIISPPKGYHWDCSDWCTPVGGMPLPNIVEIPGSEVPDTSSCYNSDNNTTTNTLTKKIKTEKSVHFEDQTKIDDKEITDDGYDIDRGATYLIHPDTYLPCFTYSSTDGECEVEHEPDDGVEPYGFPSVRRRQTYKDGEIGSVISMLDENNSLLNPGSTSDISVNVCEIEDSDNDYKSNSKKSKWKTNSPNNSHV